MVAPDLGPAPTDLGVSDDLAVANDEGSAIDSSIPSEDASASGSTYAGTWAQIQRSATVTDSPLGGDTFDTTIHTLHLVVIGENEDGSLNAEHTICDIQAESDFMQTETIIPAAYVASLESYTRTVSFDSSTSTFTAEKVTEVKGCTLTDLENEELPTSDDDPRVFDQDGDGNPGMTIQISGLITGDLYVVERNWTQLEGSIVSEDRVEGLLTWGVEQNKIGTSNLLLSMDISSWVDPDTSKSTFEMTRVNEGDGCYELISQFGQLF